MIRVTMANALVKRTLKPLYEQRQATPINTFLDSAEAGNVYSGMVATRTGTDKVALCDGASQIPWGIFALDKNAVINDLDGFSDILPIAVYQGGPDAWFQIDAPAFDSAAAAGYTVPVTGATRVLLYAGTGAKKGMVTSDKANAAALPVGELVEVVSTTRIVVRAAVPPAFVATGTLV